MKEQSPFVLDARLALPFSGMEEINLDDFCDLAELAAANASFFNEPKGSNLDFTWQKGWIKFSSSISTETAENNLVSAKVTESQSRKKALIVFHHWNASTRYDHIAKFLSRRGITVVQIALPYHFERSRPGSQFADYMLSSNLGRTIQSVRQAVLDGRKLIRVLKHRNYEQISVLGMSLGSWVAGLVAANDPAVKKAALFLTAGSLADMVWTGRATEHIRASLAGQIDVTQLSKAWSPLNLENYVAQLARPGLELQLSLAKRDTVVLPHLSQPLVAMLRQAGARADVLELNCGHYSFALPPYILRTGLRTLRLLA
ncbi:alpha/beta hydrolase family protein [Paracoccus rhizosphaerae]|uniref:Alpha/beta hydrolase family protein n=1 Tax=Paracoccus rhizosphaerae TaxID=1133347 RepID=A0ABV6CL63_9RHOB|nr:dienelactone hydrolase-related enzyme [Paracoccus rhizosphaerae]